MTFLFRCYYTIFYRSHIFILTCPCTFYCRIIIICIQNIQIIFIQIHVLCRHLQLTFLHIALRNACSGFCICTKLRCSFFKNSKLSLICDRCYTIIIYIPINFLICCIFRINSSLHLNRFIFYSCHRSLI